MSCDRLNGFIIWSLTLLAIGDLFILYAEMKRQCCDKITEKDREAEIDKMKQEIEILQQEINNLKSKCK